MSVSELRAHQERAGERSRRRARVERGLLEPVLGQTGSSHSCNIKATVGSGLAVTASTNRPAPLRLDPCSCLSVTEPNQTWFSVRVYLLLSPDACRLQTLMKVEARMKKNMYRHTELCDQRAQTVCAIIFFRVCVMPLRATSGRSFCVSLQTFCNNKLWQLCS